MKYSETPVLLVDDRPENLIELEGLPDGMGLDVGGGLKMIGFKETIRRLKDASPQEGEA